MKTCELSFDPFPLSNSQRWDWGKVGKRRDDLREIKKDITGYLSK
jgi:hypothetical protein